MQRTLRPCGYHTVSTLCHLLSPISFFAVPIAFFGNEKWFAARRDVLFPIKYLQRSILSLSPSFIPFPSSRISSGFADKCCSAVLSSRLLLLSYLSYPRSRPASLMALRRFEASVWVVGSCCESPLSPPTATSMRRPTFSNILNCGDIGGFYVYTRLAFLSSRGSFALVVYTTVMLISCSRERPARGFCCYRGVYIFIPSLQCSIFFG